MVDYSHQHEANTTNVLVHTPAMTTDDELPYLDFLTTTPPSQTNLLVVSYTQTPDDWLPTWLDQTGERPAELGFIHVGDKTRSATTSQTATTDTLPVVETVANPRNLTALGITISEYLAAWEENPQTTVVCFDSVTALLQYTEGVQTTFQFLHTLIGRVQTAQARACYLITPEAHDKQTMATLTSLFDDSYEA